MLQGQASVQVRALNLSGLKAHYNKYHLPWFGFPAKHTLRQAVGGRQGVISGEKGESGGKRR